MNDAWIFQDERVNSRSTKSPDAQENDEILKELSATKLQLENSLKRNQELEVKLKADIKVLVKEVKLLRSSQTDLKQELSQSLEEKSEAKVIWCSIRIMFILLFIQL